MDRKDRNFVLAACVGSAVLGATGSQFLSFRDAHAQAGTLRTSRLEIVDNAGRVRAVFAIAKDGQPIVSLLGRSGEPRATMSLGDADAPVFHMNGRNGKSRMVMALGDADVPVFTMHGTASKRIPRVC